mmetsp:Transcript_6042/g.18085  ORF Transcript_6042/g.18085 Transcript_6042/m.18085 type:complete len:223 (-) Transcript_6042:15-683(-)
MDTGPELVVAVVVVPQAAVLAHGGLGLCGAVDLDEFDRVPQRELASSAGDDLLLHGYWRDPRDHLHRTLSLLRGWSKTHGREASKRVARGKEKEVRKCALRHGRRTQAREREEGRATWNSNSLGTYREPLGRVRAEAVPLSQAGGAPQVVRESSPLTVRRGYRRRRSHRRTKDPRGPISSQRLERALHHALRLPRQPTHWPQRLRPPLHHRTFNSFFTSNRP